MTSVDYYKHYFQTDLLNINDTIDNYPGLSYHWLVSKSSGKTRRAFLNTKSKMLFLFCYFYTTLIDQAIHSATNELHPDFQKISGYPKFVGIFHSSSSNMHPALLLLIATAYIDNEDEYELTKEFEDLTLFFLNDYVDFFHNIFPKYTLHLQFKDLQDNAIESIFKDIKEAMNWESVPKSINIIQPDIPLYKNWIKILNQAIITKLENV